MNRFSVVALLAALALPVSLSAQARMGLLAGVNFASLSGDDAAETQTRTGPVLGAALLMPLGGSLGLEINGLYSVRGAKASEDGIAVGLKLSYLEVPVLLRYTISGSDQVRPYLSGGVSMGLQTSCKVEANDSFIDVDMNCSLFKEETGVEFTKFDALLVVGGGLDFAVGTNTLTLGARYNYGLTDIVSEGSASNRGITLMAGFSIPLAR